MDEGLPSLIIFLQLFVSLETPVPVVSLVHIMGSTPEPRIWACWAQVHEGLDFLAEQPQEAGAALGLERQWGPSLCLVWARQDVPLRDGFQIVSEWQNGFSQTLQYLVCCRGSGLSLPPAPHDSRCTLWLPICRFRMHCKNLPYRVFAWQSIHCCGPWFTANLIFRYIHQVKKFSGCHSQTFLFQPIKHSSLVLHFSVGCIMSVCVYIYI